MFKQVEANCGKRTKILGNLQFTQRKKKDTNYKRQYYAEIEWISFYVVHVNKTQ